MVNAFVSPEPEISNLHSNVIQIKSLPKIEMGLQA